MEIPFDKPELWVEFPFAPFRTDETGEQPADTVHLYELSEGDRFEDADGRRFTYCAEGPVQGACVVEEEGVFCQFESTALMRKVANPAEVQANPVHKRRAEALTKLADEYGEEPGASRNSSCEDLGKWIDGLEGELPPWIAVTNQTHEGDVHYFYPCLKREEAREKAEEHIQDGLFPEQPVMIFNLDTGEREEAHLGVEWPHPGKSTPIIVTGGETGCGEVLRGEILHIDYDEAAENLEYAREMLSAADVAHAPNAVIESLQDIITDTHGETPVMTSRP